jgi:protein-L-isoaspartate(D-aspartate) O-methyltransferase
VLVIGCGFEPFDELDIWTTTAADEFALLVAKAGAIESGLVARSARMGAKTLLGDDSFAYRASGPTSTQRTLFEFVAYGHGPQGERLADEHVELIRTWDQVHRNGPGARIEVFPAGIADDQLPAGRVIEKHRTRVVIVWPEQPGFRRRDRACRHPSAHNGASAVARPQHHTAAHRGAGG